jgi:uncharacterized protein (DUF488 family)
MTIFTVGHSTRDEVEFLALLQEFRIELLVDVRAVPASTRNPQFNRENLETRLPLLGIEYLWMGQELGGFRKKSQALGDSSPNSAWKDPSFRNYADYMLTDAFQEAAARLAAMALEKRTAFLCAERLHTRCHRQLISDYLVCQGWEVEHILDRGTLKKHTLTPIARCDAGRLTYPGDAKLF